METVTINLVPRKRDVPDKLEHILKSIPGVQDVKINLEENFINLNISPDVDVQFIINEINIKTGFKAF